MPTSPTNTYANTGVQPVMNSEEAMGSQLRVKLKASTTFAAGTVLGEITASPGTYGPYASGNVDGTQNPTGILQYAAVTDGSSNISFSEWGEPVYSMPMFTKGTFRTQDLIGLDANAVTKLAGKLIEGTVSSGMLDF